MAVQSNLTLNSVVYTPGGRDAAGIASWFNRVLSASFPRVVSESVKGPSAAGVYRASFKLVLPSVVAEASECGCAGDLSSQAIATIDVLIPAKFSSAERADLRAQITALAASAPFVAAVESLEGAW